MGTKLPSPESMIGSLSSSLIGEAGLPEYTFNYIHPLQKKLMQNYKIEVPVISRNKILMIRIAVQCYNSLEQYDYLAMALAEISIKG